MSAAEQLAALDDMPARDLIGLTQSTLDSLARMMNDETTLLRAGRQREAAPYSAEKTRLAQEYVGYARAVQRQLPRLQVEAPGDVARLRGGHERLATQMAENLKVIATARLVTEDLLTDVALHVARTDRPKTYGAGGELTQPRKVTGGIAINRAL